MIALAALLLWLSLRSLNVVEGESKAAFLWKTWQKSDKTYLWIMAFIAIASHVLRAYRWKMLLQPTGNEVKLGNSFLSLMVGYLVNLAIPRGGEVSRCYNLFKLERTPIEISFGTVVAERAVDVLCLLLLIVISFLLEWSRLFGFIESLELSRQGWEIPVWVYFALLGIVGLVAMIFFFRKNERIRKIMEGFRNGLLAVFRIENKLSFVVLSVLIWALYFAMSYFVIKAFPETEALGFSAVFTLFAVGSIAMAAPLPGGAGSYHTLVPLALVVLYNLPQKDAIAFVFVFHAWQTAIMIAGGILSLMITYWMVWRQRQQK